MRDRSRPLLKSFLGCLFWVAVAWVLGPERVSAEAGAQWDLTTSSSSESSAEQISSDYGAPSSDASSVDGEPTVGPSPTPSCDADGDGDRAVGECGGADCDDNDASVSSLKNEGWDGSFDTCFDGKDNNCSSGVDCADPNCGQALQFLKHRMCCGSGAPVDFLIDPNNCGNCGIKCAEGQPCRGGRCGTLQPPSPELKCEEVELPSSLLAKVPYLDPLEQFLLGPPFLVKKGGKVIACWQRVFDSDGNEIFPPKKDLLIGIEVPF